jgi:GNAT superfamily N-acetyltransferase
MTYYHIRKALSPDLDRLRELEQALIEAERPFDPTIKRDLVRYYDLEAMIGSPDILLLVVENDDGLIVGTGYARIDTAKAFLIHDRQAYLGFMYLLPECRGLGINARVIATLRDWALSRGVDEFRLEVYSGNIPAMKAYEKMGFRPYSLEMRMQVAGRERDLANGGSKT